MRPAKTIAMAIGVIGIIKTGHVENEQPSVRGETAFVRNLFSAAA